MRNLLLGSLLLVGLVSTVSAKTYKCYRYVGGHPVGTWVKVYASDKSEAEYNAMKKFKDLGGRVDGTNCHFISK